MMHFGKRGATDFSGLVKHLDAQNERCFPTLATSFLFERDTASSDLKQNEDFKLLLHCIPESKVVLEGMCKKTAHGQ